MDIFLNFFFNFSISCKIFYVAIQTIDKIDDGKYDVAYLAEINISLI